MTKEGTSLEDAYSKIFMLDSKGLIVKSRANLTEHKLHFAKVLIFEFEFDEVLSLTHYKLLVGILIQISNEVLPRIWSRVRTLQRLCERSNPQFSLGLLLNLKHSLRKSLRR